MNEILNNFFLAVDKFMPEMHLRKLGFTYIAAGAFPKNNLKKYKNSKKKKVHDIFIKTNEIKLVFNTT